MSSHHDTTVFSIPLARSLVKDLFEPRAAIYWADFLVSLVVGYGAAFAYLHAMPFSWWQATCLLVAMFALFRLGSFIHEVVHLQGRTLRTFRVVWNLLAGVPMMMPSFFYGNHIDHHSSHHYGTTRDGEYLPLGTGLWSESGRLLLCRWCSCRLRSSSVSWCSLRYPFFIHDFDNGRWNAPHRLSLTFATAETSPPTPRAGGGP